jgi:hypothetical protein
MKKKAIQTEKAPTELAEDHFARQVAVFFSPCGGLI